MVTLPEGAHEIGETGKLHRLRHCGHLQQAKHETQKDSTAVLHSYTSILDFDLSISAFAITNTQRPSSVATQKKGYWPWQQNQAASARSRRSLIENCNFLYVTPEKLPLVLFCMNWFAAKNSAALQDQTNATTL